MRDRPSEDRAELDRIRSVYREYAKSPDKKRAWADGTAQRFHLNRKWACIRERLAHHRVAPKESIVLDLGVGGGTECPSMLEAGFQPRNFFALDLNEDGVRTSRRKFHWLCALVGNGTRLPFHDQTFDIVYQSTVISSVLNPELRLALMREAGRVLRPGGLFISYDMRYPNPWNSNTRPLRIPEIRSAFPCWDLSVSSLTGIPQIIRPLSRISLSLCRLVETVPFLRSHLLVFARKP